MNGNRASQELSRRGVRNIQRGRRGFLGMMGGAGAALVAAACGGSNNKSSGAATTVATRAAATTAGTSAAAVTVAGTAAAARTTPAAPVKVSTVTYFGIDVAPEETAWHKKFNDDFAAAFPQYRAEDSEYASGTEFYPKLQTALASHSEPDFIFRDSGGTNLVTLWDLGLLAPVNDVMDAVYKIIGGKDKFDAGAVDRFTLPSGDVFGVPQSVSPYVMWYRTDLFQEAGLTPPAGHWDWNFLLKAVKALHKPPTVYGIGIPLGRNTTGLQVGFGQFILGNGGHFVTQDLKDVLFDSPEVRDALDLVKELAQYAPPDATNWAFPEQINAIVQGNVAMGVYLGRVFANLSTMNPSLIPKISNTAIPYNKVPHNWGGYAAHGLFKSSKTPQGAKELMQFSLSKDQYISYLVKSPGGYNPAIPSYGADPSYTGSSVLKAFDPKLLATITEAQKDLGDLLKEGPGWKVNPKAGTLSGSLFYADVVQKVVIGKESTPSAVTWGAGQIRDIMKG